MYKDGHIQCARTFFLTDLSKFVGIPYLLGGRTFGGCDCYGLAVLLYKQNGIILPDVEVDSLEESTKVFIEEENRGYWAKVSTASCGSLAVFKNKAELPTHCGVMLDRRRILHTVKGSRSCIEKIDSPIWKGQLYGFFEFNGIS